MAAAADPSSGFDCSDLEGGLKGVLREGLWAWASDDQRVGLSRAVAVTMSHDAEAEVDCSFD